MKILFKTLFLSLIFFTAGHNLSAQEYSSAVGLRLGYPLSASYKTFISDNSALEGYVGFRSFGFGNWISIHGAYQVHNPINGVDGLQWYYGGGLGIFIWSYDFDTSFASTSFGLQGYLGLDYKFPNTPISITLDWVPTFFIGNININSFGGDYGALGVRYVFAE